MMNEFKNILGFEFIKAGDFYLEDVPITGKDKTGNWQSHAALKLFDVRYRKADETVYFVTVDDQIKYVGEFTYNLENRWLRGHYVNHHKYREIEMVLEDGKNVSIWLAIEPYCKVGVLNEFNLSKSLEQELIKELEPEWNSKNKTAKWQQWRAENCIKLNTILSKP